MSTIIQHNQATCQLFNPNHYLVQFVCFETSLPNDRFLSIWQPFVTDFLNKAIELLVLNEVQVSSFQSVPYRFISPDCSVPVAQVGSFLFSDYILPPNIDPRA
ncbi:unnamed protein product [Rotaria magnacalcarata]|uniref:Uncharacterized protein n=1 Tax=Rotaria magnacalcarata TaxID=392030 RepID=A0A816WTQ7_9BILA|nr:unnamed protein product [Rotaria magnacalcarata]